MIAIGNSPQKHYPWDQRPWADEGFGIAGWLWGSGLTVLGLSSLSQWKHSASCSSRS